MKFAKKEFSFYWPAIMWPTLILVAWSIVGLIIALTAFESYKSIFANQWLGLVPFLLFLIAGYLAASDHKATAKEAAWAGALTAIITSIVGVIVMFILMYATPYMQWGIDLTMSKAAASGQAMPDPAMLKNIMSVTMKIGSVFGIAINGCLGALMGWLGSLLAKKF